MNVELSLATMDDLNTIMTIEQNPDTNLFISPYSLQEHTENICHPDVVYLTIQSARLVVGFIILFIDPNSSSIEFRRIAIAQKGQGIGQRAISMMEDFCRENIKRSRIWLDVFSNNPVGIHIYEKLGYQKFGKETFKGRTLLLYEKEL